MEISRDNIIQDNQKSEFLEQVFEICGKKNLKFIKKLGTNDDEFVALVQDQNGEQMVLKREEIPHDTILPYLMINSETALPYVAKIINIFSSNDVRWSLVEYVEGLEVQDYVKEQLDSKQYETVRLILIQLLLLFEDMNHKHISHRDLHGRNIIVTEDKRIRFIDFSRATKSDSPSWVSDMRKLVGSLLTTISSKTNNPRLREIFNSAAKNSTGRFSPYRLRRMLESEDFF